MTDHQAHSADTDERVFAWHPVYQGRTAESVEHELAAGLAKDQCAYELALAGADKAEHQALASVMELEKRWSIYSFGWAEMPADDLARRIVDFELERDRRHEMIPYEQYREEAGPVTMSHPSGGWRESMSDEQRRRVASIGAVVVIAVVVLMLIIVMSIVL